MGLASISGHKIYSPKGVGALFVRRRPRIRPSALFSGECRRVGCGPAPLIVCLGGACRLATAEMAGEAERTGALRIELLERLRREIPRVQLNGRVQLSGSVQSNGSVQARIAGIINLTFPAAAGGDLMDAVPDLCVSTGSACSSAAIEPSFVLRALGLSEQEAERNLRIRIGRFTSPPIPITPPRCCQRPMPSTKRPILKPEQLNTRPNSYAENDIY